MTAKTGLDLLREPFAAAHISKLPKPTKAQTEAVKADYKKGIRCALCGAWHHPEVVHLDYVGHAALTHRLLDADPGWTWEPAAVDPTGHPIMDSIGGMWIRLTVCGVTRLGYGHAGDKSGGDAVKEIIGDALRNAAMRFGAALDLWHKGDLHAEPEAEETRMLPTRIAEWCDAIMQAGPDEVDAMIADGLKAAEECKDRDAYGAIRTAGRKRIAQLPQPKDKA